MTIASPHKEVCASGFEESITAANRRVPAPAPSDQIQSRQHRGVAVGSIGTIARRYHAVLLFSTRESVARLRGFRNRVETHKCTAIVGLLAD